MISNSAFEQIQREYGDKRLASQHALEEKRAIIESKIPKIKTIENAVASLSVAQAIAKIKGQPADPDYENKIFLLKAEKERLLLENGFSAADLEPVYECSLCKDTGYIEDQMCTCLRNRITDTLYGQLHIKEVLQKENFRSFSYDYYSRQIPQGETESPLVVAQKAVMTALDFIRNFDSSADNLFICGNTGVGKTFLTNCIVKELIDRGYFVIYLSAQRFFQLLSDARFNRTEADTEYISEHLYSCDLLVIDDLGTELTNSFVVSALFDCLNERLMAKKHTVISTNLSLDQVRDIYTERISSRITDAYKCIRLLGDDIRIKKKLEA